MGNSIFSIPEICLGIAVCNLLKKLPVRFGESAVINLLNPVGKTAAQVCNIGLPRLKAKEVTEFFPKFCLIHQIQQLQLPFYLRFIHHAVTPLLFSIYKHLSLRLSSSFALILRRTAAIRSIA